MSQVYLGVEEFGICVLDKRDAQKRDRALEHAGRFSGKAMPWKIITVYDSAVT